MSNYQEQAAKLAIEEIQRKRAQEQANKKRLRIAQIVVGIVTVIIIVGYLALL